MKMKPVALFYHQHAHSFLQPKLVLPPSLTEVVVNETHRLLTTTRTQLLAPHVEEGISRSSPSSFEINHTHNPLRTSLLATLRVTIGNIESAPNTPQTQPKTPSRNQNKTQNTNRTG